MAYSAISKPSLHFNTKLYTGNGSAGNAQTGVGFQPDLVWIKKRSASDNNALTDVIRGVNKTIFSDTTGAEDSTTNMMTGFDSDGFTVGNNGMVNGNSATYAAWNWKAGNSQGSSNTDGTINTTYTSVNTTAGFSISQYTGNGTVGATFGHGLGATVKFLIIKKTDEVKDWTVKVIPPAAGADRLELNNNDATASEGAGSGRLFNATNPNSSVITLGDHAQTNENGAAYIAYSWAEIKGFSSFGSYKGNGGTDGAFIYTGFKPALVTVKRSNSTGSWNVFDNKREGFNADNSNLYWNSNSAEQTDSDRTNPIDFLSNGFKLRASDSDYNGTNDTYAYMAFAENPFVANVGSNGIAATAR